ncbi:MAG: universal stress protein [Planctomycetota bacterium]
MSFQSLLISTDFSPESEWAVQWGSAIAQRYAAKLTILHVVEALPVHAYVLPNEPGAFANLYQERMLQRARSELHDVAERVAGTGVQPETMLLSGMPVEEILSATAHLRADLLIMAARSRSALARALLGSVTEKVLRHVGCSVLSVKRPGSGDAPRRPQLEKILFATDLSDLSLVAVEPVRSLMSAFNARVDIFHAVADPAQYPLMSWEIFPAIAASDFYERSKAAASDALREKVEPHFVGVRDTAYSVGVGNAAEAILAAQADGGHDLIVMSTHGYSGMKRVLLGSVAERVVRLADCPVLVVPAAHRVTKV